MSKEYNLRRLLYLEVSLAVLFSCSFAATDVAALFQGFEKALHKASSRVV
jgi:hypothetical protein